MLELTTRGSSGPELPDVEWSRLGWERCNGSAGDFDVLLDCAGAGSHGADDVSIKRDRDTASEDDDLPFVGLLNPVQRLAGPREFGKERGWLIEDPGSHCLVDRQTDAADKGAILTHEG